MYNELKTKIETLDEKKLSFWVCKDCLNISELDLFKYYFYRSGYCTKCGSIAELSNPYINTLILECTGKAKEEFSVDKIQRVIFDNAVLMIHFPKS